MIAEELPRGIRPEVFEAIAGVVVNGFEVGGALAERDEVEPATEPRPAELNGESTAEEPGRRAGPRADRAGPFADRQRLPVVPLRVEVSDATEVRGAEFHRV